MATIALVGLCAVVGAAPAPGLDAFTDVSQSASSATSAGPVVVSTPNGGPYNTLHGVSCVSVSACTAVGDYGNGAAFVTLAERWNASRWTIQDTPNPAGGRFSHLLGVSCVAPRACTAVGSYATSAGTGVTLGELWNGSRWTIQRTPNPAGGRVSQLLGVSCAAPRTCTAVGDYANPAATGTLAERWNGSRWTIQRTPNPAGARFSQLLGVSCTSPRTCTAVGEYRNKAGTEVTLVEGWNGSRWTIRRTPNPTGAMFSELLGVWCASRRACTAVGRYDRRAGTVVTLAEGWNGSRWTIQRTPNPAAASSTLSGVSCASPRACTAVGDHFAAHADTDLTLAERWNGSRWTIQHTPNPTGAEFSQLLGVSCTSVIACTAAGYYSKNGGFSLTLAERW